MKELKELIYYTLNILSGIIFILSVPSQEAKNFLEAYSILSGLSSMLIVYSLSKKSLIQNFKLTAALSFFACLIISFFDQGLGLIAGYAFAAILIDYIATQAYVEQRNRIRVISFLFNAVLIFELIEVLMCLRIFLGLSLLVLMAKNKKATRILNVKNPEWVIIKSNLIYFGALYLIAIQNLVNLQYVYIFSQMGLSFALKIYDFRTRLNYEMSKIVYNSMRIIGISPVVLIVWFAKDVGIALIFIVAYILLIRLERVI